MNKQRLSTGSAELDEVLSGGFPIGSMTIIMGRPGSGKTILAEQIAFANATPERPAIYYSTLSEPLEKFIEHGQKHSFFDPEKVGVAVFYEDLGSILRERGITKLVEVITEMIAERKPALIGIDSFKALSEIQATGEERRTTVFDLASLLASSDCTTLLVGEYAPENMTQLPEFAVADGVVQMLKQDTGAREQRFLRVEKLRGSGSIPGLHAFSISREGIRVYPRLLTPPESPPYDAKVERVVTGIEGLDDMIEQGFWRGSTTLVAGPTGSGKTIIGLHFIREGVGLGEPGVFVGFQENPVQLSRIMHNFGWEADKLFASGFELMYRSPVEMELDCVAAELFNLVRDGKIKRVVIDALGDLHRRSMDNERFTDYLYSLTQWFAVENVTCLAMLEMEDLFEFHSISHGDISNMSDNIVLLRFTSDDEMRRTVRIVKTRGSSHDHSEHTLNISAKGVVVEGTRKWIPKR